MSETVPQAIVLTAAAFERDIWLYLTDAPPPPMQVHHFCMLASQMVSADIYTKQHGCCALHATGFIMALHELRNGLDWLGGEERLGRSLLWAALPVFDELERALLDVMARDAS